MAELALGELCEVLDACGDRVCLVDPADWRVVFANRAFRDFVVEPESGSLFESLPALEAGRELLDRVARGQIDDARLAAVGTNAISARKIGRWVAIFVRRIESESLQRRDPLTGLADRAFFLERLGTLLAGERMGDRHCAVLFIDVDGFKQINDSYGHLVGDRVLGEVAARLASCIRVRDLVARFGGDEFVVLLESVRGTEDFEPVAERLRSAFVRPIELPDGEVQLAVSVGAAEAGPATQTAEALINAADRAMYAAKRAATK